MMKRFAALLMALGLALAAGQPALCADDTGLLNELELAIEEEEVKVSEEADTSIEAQLMRNLDLSVRLRGSHHSHSAADLGGLIDQDRQMDYGEIKIDFGSSFETERYRLAFDGWIEHGNQEDTYKSGVGLVPEDQRRRNLLEINELYLTVPVSSVDLTVGKRIIDNGISTIFSPADRYNSFDLNDPLDPHQFGTWQAALEGDHADVSWMLAVLPAPQTPKTPSEGSRWLAGGATDAELAAYFSASAYGSLDEYYSEIRENLYYFAWLLESEGEFDEWMAETLLDEFGWVSTGSEDLSISYDEADEPGVFTNARGAVGDWDLLLSAYHGPGMYPVMRMDLDRATPGVHITVEHPTVTQLGGGFSTIYKELEFHGEALVSYSDEGTDDDYVNYVIGTRWTNESLAEKLGLYRIDAGVEYAGEALLDEQDAGGYVYSSREIRIGKNDVIMGLALHFTEDIRLHYLADFELTRDSHLNRVGLGWDVTDQLNADLTAEFFDGPSYSYYGFWDRQDRVILTLTYKFF